VEEATDRASTGNLKNLPLEDQKRTFDEKAETNAKANELWIRIGSASIRTKQTTVDLWKCLLAFARYVKTQCREKPRQTEKNLWQRSAISKLRLLASCKQYSRKSGSV
jgi:hypothetical protein